MQFALMASCTASGAHQKSEPRTVRILENVQSNKNSENSKESDCVKRVMRHFNPVLPVANGPLQHSTRLAPAVQRLLPPSHALTHGLGCGTETVLVFHQICNAILSARRKRHVRDCQLLPAPVLKGTYTGGALGLQGSKWVYGITESVTSAHPSQLGLSQESRSRPLRKSKDQKHSVGILSRKVMPHMAPWSPSLCCMPRHAAPPSPSYTQTQIHKYRPCRKLCWVKIRPATPAHQNLTPVRSRRALTRSRKPPLTSREKCG